MKGIFQYYFVVFLLLNIALSATAQNSQVNERMLELLYQEISSDKAATDKKSFTTVKVVMGDSCFIDLSEKPDFYPGISDPGTDYSNGFRQAVLRALILYSLQTQSRISVVSDNFTVQSGQHSGSGSKYEELYRIESNMVIPEMLFALPPYQLSSGEIIIWLYLPQKFPEVHDFTADSSLTVSGQNLVVIKSFDSEKTLHSFYNLDTSKIIRNLNFRAELYHVEKIMNHSRHVFRTSYLSIQSDSSKMIPARDEINFVWIPGRRSACDYSSDSINERNVNKRFLYFQTGADPLPDSIVEQSIGITASDGMWPAMISSILWQLPELTVPASTVIREMSQNYGAMHSRLNRSVMSDIISFRLSDIRLSKGKLYIFINK